MSEVLLTDIKIGERFRKDLGNVKSLAKSIKEVGLLHPIVLDENNNLIAGFRRIKAFEALNRETIPFTIISVDDLKEGEIQENRERKNFTASEMVAIKRYMEPELTIEAEKRKKSSLKKGAKKPRASKKDERDKGRTDNRIAKACGVSKGTLRKAEKIVEAAEKNPQEFKGLLEKVDSGKVSINYAHDKIKRAHKHKSPPPLPTDEFDVIYADPPWHYNMKSRGAENHYPVIDELELTKLEIPFAKDSILFLWATNAKLKEALTIMASWGFTYKTNLVWVKDKIGTGFYVRGKHELLLIGRKGEIPTPMEATRPSSVILEGVQEHSKKPDIVYEMIESMYPNRKYLELFARQTREGWVSWGDEI